MKRFLLTGLFFVFAAQSIFANEITEDYFDIATNYCIEGNYREAVNYLDKILLIESDNKTVSDLRNGLRLIMQGKNTSFIIPKSYAVKQSIDAKRLGDDELSSLVKGNDCWAFYFLGEYYRQNKDYKQAIDYFVKSVNEKPNFTQCYLKIAICYFEMKNYYQTVTYLNQYLKINQQDDFAYALRANANTNLNNNDLALNDILTAIALENAVEYRFLEGKILFNMKRYQQSLEKLEKLTSEIQTAEIYKYIGFSQAELGKYTDAAINLEKAILLTDDDKLLNTKYNEIKSRIER